MQIKPTRHSGARVWPWIHPWHVADRKASTPQRRCRPAGGGPGRFPAAAAAGVRVVSASIAVCAARTGVCRVGGRRPRRRALKCAGTGDGGRAPIKAFSFTLTRRNAMDHTGSAAWKGGIKDGGGSLSVQSGVLKDTPYGFKARFEDGPGTNPEELIGAAHAGCFTMALSGELGRAGLTADSLKPPSRWTRRPAASPSRRSISTWSARCRAPIRRVSRRSPTTPRSGARFPSSSRAIRRSR